MEQMEDRLRTHLSTAASELPADPRVERLETDMKEIKIQNCKSSSGSKKQEPSLGV